ncbi:MAG: hypothetical protein V4671_08950 [Armatimonadota bacterium]
MIWIGGGDWSGGGPEYNLANDIAAANAVFKSSVDVWQIPSTVYRLVAVSYSELGEKVFFQGAIGRNLVE